jgi:hypothetical protein
MNPSVCWTVLGEADWRRVRNRRPFWPGREGTPRLDPTQPLTAAARPVPPAVGRHLVGHWRHLGPRCRRHHPAVPGAGHGSAGLTAGERVPRDRRLAAPIQPVGSETHPIPVRVGGVDAPVSEGRLAAVDPSAGRPVQRRLPHLRDSIAVFDLDQVTGNLTVRHATGTETLCDLHWAIPKPGGRARTIRAEHRGDAARWLAGRALTSTARTGC